MEEMDEIKDIYEKTKCAEVYRSERGELTYLCLICTEELLNAMQFEDHIQQHFPGLEDTIATKYDESNDPDTPVFPIENVSIMEFTSAINKFEIEIADNYSEDRKSIKSEYRITNISCPGLANKYAEKNNYKSYHCSFCTAYFDNNDEMEKHQNLHSLTNLPKCLYCDQIFEFQSDLDKHLSNNDDPPSTKHNISFSRKRKRIVSNGKPRECEICKRLIFKMSNYKRHVETHMEKQPRWFECDICGHRFKEKQNLNAHLRVHTGEKPYKCKFCKKSFSQSSYLTIHYKIHNNERNFQCAVCGKFFYIVSQLNMHMKKHNNTEKIYYCAICQMEFKKLPSLKIHLRRHTGEKPYNCDICHTRFSSTKTLRQHTMIHSNEKNFSCKYCGLKFAQPAGRRGHEKKRHEIL